jgi:hypothetical protein
MIRIQWAKPFLYLLTVLGNLPIQRRRKQLYIKNEQGYPLLSPPENFATCFYFFLFLLVFDVPF